MAGRRAASCVAQFIRISDTVASEWGLSGGVDELESEEEQQEEVGGGGWRGMCAMGLGEGGAEGAHVSASNSYLQFKVSAWACQRASGRVVCEGFSEQC